MAGRHELLHRQLRGVGRRDRNRAGNAADVGGAGTTTSGGWPRRPPDVRSRARRLTGTGWARDLSSGADNRARRLGLLLRKTFIWFAGHEVSNDRDLYAVKRYSFINYLFFNSRFLKFPFGILLPLALAGAWFCRRQWRRFLPLLPLCRGVLALVHRLLRHQPLPAADGADCGNPRGHGSDRTHRTYGADASAVSPLAIAVAAFLLFNANLAGAGRPVSQDQNHFDAAIGLHEQGKDVEALAELREALKLDSATEACSQSKRTCSRLTATFAEAERAARAAIRLHPSDADAYGILGNVFAYAGRFDSAAVYFEALLERSPYAVHGVEQPRQHRPVAQGLRQGPLLLRRRAQDTADGRRRPCTASGSATTTKARSPRPAPAGSRSSNSTLPSPRPDRRSNRRSSRGRAVPSPVAVRRLSISGFGRPSCLTGRRGGCIILRLRVAPENAIQACCSSVPGRVASGWRCQGKKPQGGKMRRPYAAGSVVE